MKWRCLFGHKWPRHAEMPRVADDEPMVIRCERCLESRVVYGWLREAFEIIEARGRK